jgi:hypothetical protein
MELTIAQKLEALLKLQSIESQLDELKKIYAVTYRKRYGSGR